MIHSLAFCKMAAPFRVIFLVFIASFFVIGLYDILTNFEDNGCEMTYMYEWPQYMKVPLKKEVQSKFPRYSLYLYGEGKYAKESQGSTKLKGIPVLFIPGNAGSYKQVRSLGSVALRKAESSTFHFNYFSMDLNEELTGIYGGILNDQTEFTYRCIKHILNMYEKTAANRPKSVILVGHSMGGMIARGVFTLPTFDPDLVTTIITQATPHQAPVVNLDPYINDYYQKVNEYWRTHTNTSLKYVTVLSTGGGFRDILVRHGLTSLKGLVSYDRGLSTSSMSVPRAWVSTDHLCHVWCKQIVLATKRAMFDIVDKNTKQVAVNPMYRLSSFIHHFEHHTGPTQFKSAFDKIIKVNPDIKWEIRKRKSWKMTRATVSTTRYSVVPLPRDEFHGFAITTNIDNEAWIGTCTVLPKKKQCSELKNLAPKASLIPPTDSGRKFLYLSPEDLMTESHLVVIIPKSKTRIEIMAELYNATARNSLYELPTVLNFFKSDSEITLGTEVMLNKTDNNAVFHNISIQGLDFPVDAYTAHLVTTQCKDKDAEKYPGNVMKFYVPWNREATYSIIGYGQSGNLSVKLQSSKPPGFPYHAQLHLFLHPGCTYHVTLTRSWAEMFGQFVRFYGPLLPAFLVIQVFMTLSWQFKQLDEEGIAGSFWFSHSRWAQPWRVVPLSLLFKFLVSYPEENALAPKLGLPQDDPSLMLEQGIWATPLPIFLYLASYAFMELYSFTLYMVINVTGRMMFTFCKSCCMSGRLVRLAVGLEYVALVASICVAATVCGTLGVVIVYFIYITKTIASFMWGRAREESLGEWAWNRFNVNFSLLILLLLTIVINAPALIMWAKNLKYSVLLEADTSRWTGVAVSLAALLLTYADLPMPITELYGVMSGIMYISSVMMILYSMVSAYRINYFISANILIIALPVSILVAMATLVANKKKPTKMNKTQLETKEENQSTEEPEEVEDKKTK